MTKIQLVGNRAVSHIVQCVKRSFSGRLAELLAAIMHPIETVVCPTIQMPRSFSIGSAAIPRKSGSQGTGSSAITN
jgi:hypothetical protein